MQPMLKLGDTEIARIGLGTNRLTNTSEHIAFVKEAVAAGLSHIDTAHTYTAGDSEETIGTALSPIPDGCVVATKGGYRAGEGRPEALAAQIDESLRRLRTDSIALYYLHEAGFKRAWRVAEFDLFPDTSRAPQPRRFPAEHVQ